MLRVWRETPKQRFCLDFLNASLSLSCIQAGFKSSYQNTTSGSIVQCSNLHARQRVGSRDVKHNSRSGGCEFDFPNHPFLYSWSHFTSQTYLCTLWATVCVISLATKSYLFTSVPILILLFVYYAKLIIFLSYTLLTLTFKKWPFYQYILN